MSDSCIAKQRGVCDVLPPLLNVVTWPSQGPSRPSGLCCVSVSPQRLRSAAPSHHLCIVTCEELRVVPRSSVCTAYRDCTDCHFQEDTDYPTAPRAALLSSSSRSHDSSSNKHLLLSHTRTYRRAASNDIFGGGRIDPYSHCTYMCSTLAPLSPASHQDLRAVWFGIAAFVGLSPRCSLGLPGIACSESQGVHGVWSGP